MKQNNGTIMASVLIETLEAFIEEHGDQPVGLSGTYGGMTLTAIDSFDPTYDNGGDDHPIPAKYFEAKNHVVDSFTFFFDD